MAVIATHCPKCSGQGVVPCRDCQGKGGRLARIDGEINWYPCHCCSGRCIKTCGTCDGRRKIHRSY